ncbi:MAG: UDP-N-acetylglucosamine 4,6-dehydratase [Parcubacteria group bacterium GW2011_GWA2_52_8]|nr:MAG: UDP-N-acetylglucosamine 4,6-dehydratase [Parcubacteria group bacterium GW2011_GWA2_52_8]
MFDDKAILVTGGTGSFGKNFVKFLLSNFNFKKLIIFSRDELKQFQMQKEIQDERLRFFIGDVRDLSRLQRAFYGVDIVVHAAALKQVPMLEYNPFEAVKTNVIGSQNVVEAAIDQGVEKVLLISTDKAVQPVNLYGATKLCAEKLFVNGNAYAHNKTKFSCVRYGNVLGSRGSIVEVLLKNPDAQVVHLTHQEMTRFWITFDQSFQLVLFALENMVGGEIFVPKIPSMRLVDLFEVLVPQARKEVVGIRPGEKVHEALLTDAESRHAVELDKYFVILPQSKEIFDVEKRYSKYLGMGEEVPENFRFTSDTNPLWLTPQQLKVLIEGLNLK